jgi:imidazolonepropionase-like amidohydrolase
MTNKKHTILQISLQIFLVLFLSTCSSRESVDFVIKNVKLFDGNKVIEHANVYVKDGLITRIKTNEEILTCNYKYLIDGNNKTLIPGLINAHAHILNSNNLKESAQAGILTTLDLNCLTEDSIAIYKNLNDSSQYAYFYTAGVGADMPNAVLNHLSGGQYTPSLLNSKIDVEKYIANGIKNKVNYIKIFQDSRLPEKFSASIFKTLIDETHKHNMVTTIHTETLHDAIFAFDNGADILAHSWVDSLISDSELVKWNSREFYVTPTFLIHSIIIDNMHPKTYISKELMLNEINRLHKAGIKILAGTDAPNLGINFGTDLYKELDLYVKAGMTSEDALKKATINPAKAYKLKDKGVIKEGLSADFVLINGDILKDIRHLNNITNIWKRGMKIK